MDLDKKPTNLASLVEKTQGSAEFSLPSPSSVSVQSMEVYEIDPEAERKLVRKLDWLLLPSFTLIYVCNFIDRTAIGNGRVAGLEKDLGMQGYDFNIALTVFYIFYIVSDIPSNLVLKRYGSTWLAFLTIAFGVIALGSAFVTSFNGLLITRVFLGLAEGGTLPGLVYILARYYRRKELVMRIGIFHGLAPSLAGASGGLLASGLLRLPDIGIISRWRKIFFVEGIITIIVGIVLLFTMPGEPSVTKMLTPEERKLAVARLDADQAVKNQGRKEKTTWKLVLRSFNVTTTICTICFVILNLSFQGLSIFLPTIINTLGKFSTIEVQLRTVPVYTVSAFWAIANAYASFRYQNRYLALIASVMLMVIGYGMAVATTNPYARYAACFLMVAGGAPSGPMYITWGTENAAPDTIRAVASAAIPGIGAIGSVISVWTYLPADAPNYLKGNSINLATSVTACVLTGGLAFYLNRENKKRERGERDYRLDNKKLEELEELGCNHPEFKYQL
ncbi:MFS general substrate transporter [Coprinopsis marcescibilis]|uniref:MFS general substrate transporter n=1 Tax=Coprinopsis marcescibilis TaxID=230819 RepID=A0A5C3LB42_COPMA|nr:MFS general substrate transporter [Coprinopsis marcescibilis]